jgi:hypothetical protein
VSGNNSVTGYRDFLDWRQQPTVFENMAIPDREGIEVEVLRWRRFVEITHAIADHSSICCQARATGLKNAATRDPGLRSQANLRAGGEGLPEHHREYRDQRRPASTP